MKIRKPIMERSPLILGSLAIAILSVATHARADEPPQQAASVNVGVGSTSTGTSLTVEGSARVAWLKLKETTLSGAPTGAFATVEGGASGHLRIDGQSGEVQSAGVQAIESLLGHGFGSRGGAVGVFGLQGRLQYENNRQTGIEQAGPEIGSTLQLFFPIADNNSFLCLSLPLLAAPTAVTAAEVSEEAGWGAQLEWDISACAHLVTSVGEIDLRAGVTPGLNFATAPSDKDESGGSFMRIYAEATIREIADTPLQVGVRFFNTGVSPSEGGHRNVTEVLGLAGLAF
ncbi:MAG: hypothetical protein IT285_02290 [Bdellovibrionales bacterium]|nr:hypothetical protein [Bdellovibrionales bacterium]